MATFNPSGLTPVFSMSTPMIATPTMVEYPWNPEFSGANGDLCVAAILGTDNPPDPILSDPGYVYPGPVGDSPLPANNYSPILGVIYGFRYTPISPTPMVTDFYTYFIKNTPIVGNISVLVQCDGLTQYSIQYKGTVDKPGISQTDLFCVAPIQSDSTYVALGYTFPNPNVTNNNSGLLGTSSCYLGEPEALDESFPRNKKFPLSIQNYTQNLVSGESNNWFDPTKPTVNTNNYVNVIINASNWFNADYAVTEA